MRHLLLAAMLATQLSGQVFLVDINNGHGTHFTQIAAAVAAVPDGAVLLVEAGVYSAVTITNKSLTVIGEPGVIVEDIVQPFRIIGLSATKAVTLRQVSWRAVITPSTLICQNCAGRILVDDCTVDLTVVPTGGGISASSCDRVFIRDSRFERNSISDACIAADQSNVTIEDSWLRANRTGIEQWDGNVHMSNCWMQTYGSSFFGSIGVWMHGGDLRINAGTTLVGSTGFATPAVAGNGTAVIDPSTVLQTIAPTPYTSGILVTSLAMPSLTATTQGLGGTATAALDVPMASLGAIAASLPASPYLSPWNGALLWVQPVPARTVGVGPVLQSSYAVPNATWVLGVQITWQGAVLTGSSISISNSSTYAHY